MTYNQVIKRIKAIALAHKQIRTCEKGSVSDFIVNKKTKFAALFFQDNTGGISIQNKTATFSFRFFFLDLTHVSKNSEENEQDVISDCISIALDILAQMNYYTDWKVTTSNTLQIVTEYLEDVVAGVYIDLNIGVMYPLNVCNLPSDLILEIPEDMSDKNVYDVEYIASGEEGTSLTTSGDNPHIPQLYGKKILFATREYTPFYKVSSSPKANEFTWDDSTIGLNSNVPTLPNERFLFLFRNY